MKIAIEEDQKPATCRGCGRALKGSPYYTGKGAWIPETGERAKVNFYGGYVCSKSCDWSASIEMESSMPGAGAARTLGSSSRIHYNRNWSE